MQYIELTSLVDNTPVLMECTGLVVAQDDDRIVVWNACGKRTYVKETYKEVKEVLKQYTSNVAMD